LASADTKATLDQGISPAALLFTAKSVGVLGNAITVHLRNPGTANATLGVVVTGNAIVVNLATNASSVPTSTLTQIIAAIAASAPANALISAAVGRRHRQQRQQRGRSHRQPRGPDRRAG